MANDTAAPRADALDVDVGAARDAHALPQRIKLRHLRLVLVLDELGSVTRAAEHLCISPAAVFKARAEIEELIGMPLFNRRGHGWEPSLIGQQLIKTARSVMAELECLNSEFLLLRGGMRGILRIGTRTVSLQPFIAQCVVELKQQYPNLTVSLVDDSLDALLHSMDKGDINLVFAAGGPEQLPAEISKVAITQERHVVIASTGHPYLTRTDVAWPEALDAAWCMPPVGTRTRVLFDQILREWPRKGPLDLVESNSFAMRVMLMQASPMLGMVPLRTAHHVTEQGIASVLPLPMPQVFDTTYLMWREDFAMLPAARLFRDFVVSKLGSLALGATTESTLRPASRGRSTRRKTA